MTVTRKNGGSVKGGIRDLVVLGIGNPILSDDGAGIHALVEIGRSEALPPGVRMVDGGTAGPQLLASVAGCDGLMVLDAVDVGGRPGDVVRLDLRGGLAGAMPRTVHDLGLETLLQDLRLLDEFPERTVLFGIQPASVELGTKLSPPVARGLGTLVSAALDELGQWAQSSGEPAGTGNGDVNASTEDEK